MELLLAAVLFLVPPPAEGGTGLAVRASFAPPVSAQRPDSARVRRDLREAQRRFERIRVQNLPWRWSSPGGRCDERVGRMCFWHSNSGRDQDWSPPEEAEAIIQAREELLAELAEGAEIIPGDGWVLGQRVHYLGEAGRWMEAADLAGRCGPAAAWWCHALRGMALHGARLYPEAEEAFREALSRMPPSQAAEWEDPRLLVDGGGSSLLSPGADPDTVRARRERFWLLADPLYLVPGNDRLTEHFARHTASLIREEARNPHGISWGRDMTELLLRYGAEVGWERTRPSVGDIQGSVVGKQDPRGREYVPPGAYLEDPFAIAEGDWELTPPFPRSTFSTHYAPIIRPFEAQFAAFRRGDSLLVVSGYRVPADSLEGTPQSGLFLHPKARHPGWESRREDGEGVLVLQAPGLAQLVGLEVLDEEGARAWRARHGIRLPAIPPDLAALSDLILLGPPGESARTLTEAAPHALPGTILEGARQVVVGWEVYGIHTREGVGFELSVAPAPGGLLRRAGEWLRVVPREAGTRTAWEEPGHEERGPLFRALSLDLGDLPPGRYLLRVVATLPGRGSVETIRELELR